MPDASPHDTPSQKPHEPDRVAGPLKALLVFALGWVAVTEGLILARKGSTFFTAFTAPPRPGVWTVPPGSPPILTGTEGVPSNIASLSTDPAVEQPPMAPVSIQRNRVAERTFAPRPLFNAAKL